MRTPVFGLCLIPLAMSCGEPDTKITALSPDIMVAPDEISFGPIVKLYTVGTDVQILNTGRATLDIESMELEVAGGYEGVFEFDDAEPLTEIGPGGSGEVRISFTPQNYVDYRARLLVTSDDADEPVVAVGLFGTGVVGSTPDISLSAFSVDFGTVDTGATGNGYFAINNLGDGDLTILEMILEDGPFSIVTDPSGQAIAGGGEYTVIVEYSPTDDEEGHTADLTIRSTDPDEPEVTVVLLGGNGGDYETPIADIDCAAIAGTTPPRTIVLDGRLSEDPEDTEDVHNLSFEWDLVRRPDLSRTYIPSPTEDTPELFIDVAGVYEIQLVVTDFNGVSSEPEACTVNIVPDEKLYIALSWDTTDTDLDLHLVPEGNSMWGCMDCFFCNPVPYWPSAWGVPIYALDNTVGYGPENINVNDPGGMSYYIRTHFYSNHGGGETNATISIYVNHTLFDTYTQTIPSSGKRWNLGYITFDGPCTEESCEFEFTEEGEVETYAARECPAC
jgi:hypothetical protein